MQKAYVFFVIGLGTDLSRCRSQRCGRQRTAEFGDASLLNGHTIRLDRCMRFRLAPVALMLTVLFGVVTVAGAGGANASKSTAKSVKAAVRFSSAYTDLKKCGSGMTPEEEKDAEAQGSDIPTVCKGYAGYSLRVYYSACASYFQLEKGDLTIKLAEQPVDWKQKAIEWRFANGKPFAVVLRVVELAGDPCTPDTQGVSESLLVKGLQGFESIDFSIPIKGTSNPNEKARQAADKAYRASR